MEKQYLVTYDNHFAIGLKIAVDVKIGHNADETYEAIKTAISNKVGILKKVIDITYVNLLN